MLFFSDKSARSTCFLVGYLLLNLKYTNGQFNSGDEDAGPCRDFKPGDEDLQTYDFIRKFRLDLLNAPTSGVARVRGSNRFQTAYRLSANADLALPTRQVFPQGLPEQFSFICTFRNRRVTNSTWHLLRVTDVEQRAQFVVAMNADRASIDFAINNYEGQMQTISFPHAHVFDKNWHKIHFGVTRRNVTLYVDCQLIATRDIDPRGPIDANGEISVAKLANSEVSNPVMIMGHQRHQVIDLQWMLMSCDPTKPHREKCSEIPHTAQAVAPDLPMGLPPIPVQNVAQKGEMGHPGLPGLPGAVGPTGSPGLAGLTGTKGQKGELGERGLRGEQGRPGIAGIPGAPGLPGPEGPRGSPGIPGGGGPVLPGPPGRPGEKGENGGHGAPGFPGEKGERGSDGTPGIRGHDGHPGMPGRPGPPGPAGEPGSHNLVTVDAGSYSHGVQGPRGYPGAPGLSGERGPAGERGPSGSAGVPGTPGKDGPHGLPGPPGRNGQPGLPGPSGPAGRTVADAEIREICLLVLREHLGDAATAMQGPPGPPGVSKLGRPGPPGVPGSAGAAGAPGPPGDRGFVGMPGPAGEVGAQGPPGERGDKGDRGVEGVGRDGAVGPRGHPGPPGLSGEGAPGRAGDRGAPGAPGSRGARGEAGPAGPPGRCEFCDGYAQNYQIAYARAAQGNDKGP